MRRTLGSDGAIFAVEVLAELLDQHQEFQLPVLESCRWSVAPPFEGQRGVAGLTRRGFLGHGSRLAPVPVMVQQELLDVRHGGVGGSSWW